MYNFLENEFPAYSRERAQYFPFVFGQLARNKTKTSGVCRLLSSSAKVKKEKVLSQSTGWIVSGGGGGGGRRLAQCAFRLVSIFP